MRIGYWLSLAKRTIYQAFYATILFRFGFGERINKKVWDKQYEDNEWEYLSSEEEKEHYRAVIDQINKRGDKPVLLDIGCGHGVLYKYFTESLKPGFGYLGIDISEIAIKKATHYFPQGKFKVVDYDFEKLDGRFDIVVFNEVLNYFVKPVQTLLKAFEDNVADGGVIIISMFRQENGRIDLIWNDIDKKFNVLSTEVVTNAKGLTWTIKTISQRLPVGS